MWSLPDRHRPGYGSMVPLSRRLAVWRAAGADIATRLVLPVAMAASACLLWAGLVTLRGAASETVPSPMTPFTTRGDSLPLAVDGIACRDRTGLPVATLPGEIQVTLRYGRDGRLEGCLTEPGRRSAP
jgi:hypothetical protein